MRKPLTSLLALVLCCGALLATSVSAQEFEDPEDDGDDYEVSLTDAVVSEFVSVVESRCDCDPDKIQNYRRCAAGLSKKTTKAFSTGFKFVKLPLAELRSRLADEVEALVSYCESPEEEDPSDDFDDGDDDF